MNIKSTAIQVLFLRQKISLKRSYLNRNGISLQPEKTND